MPYFRNRSRLEPRLTCSISTVEPEADAVLRIEAHIDIERNDKLGNLPTSPPCQLRL
jgi:hypothetical protein